MVNEDRPSVSPQTQPRSSGHGIKPGRDIKLIRFNWLPLAPGLLFLQRGYGEAIMETMLQGLVIIGGLTFSLAASVLIEELIFGQLVRVAFARRPQIPKPRQEN
jgi:hypothetical protein